MNSDENLKKIYLAVKDCSAKCALQMFSRFFSILKKLQKNDMRSSRILDDF
jgi:hypothetical protein